MALRTLPVGLPPLTLRGLRDLIYSAPRACQEQPGLFFGPDADEDEPPLERAVRVEIARGLCGSCPVRLACLAYALRNRERYGIWAGLDAEAGELGFLAAAANRARKPARPEPPEVAA